MATDTRIAFVALLLALTPAGPGFGQGRPISAIDWLSDTVARRAPVPPREAPVKPPGLPEAITITPLSDRNLDAVGLLAPQVTGIDRGIWVALPRPGCPS